MHAVVLLAVLILGLLTACGTPAVDESQPQSALVRYDHPIGISLSMAEGFEVVEIEGILASYQGTEANVRFAEELYVSLEALGISPDMGLEDYARLILDAYVLEGEPMTDSCGNVYIAYNQVVQDQDVAYYAYFSRNDVAFWTTTFMCFAQSAPELEDDFALWASTIELPAEAVTDFVPPTEPRQELEEQEKEKLLQTMNRSTAIDWLGKSFVSAELTDGELLELSLWFSGGACSGFASQPGDQLRRFHAGKYLGRADFALGDIYCICGEQLGEYSADDDEMTWCSDHDHRDHNCDALTYLKDAWRQGDDYYLTLHKLFPDTEEHASGGTTGYYPTIQDAQAQTNVLFHASTQEELNQHTATLDASTLPLFTLRYAKQDNGDFVLVAYTIG